MKPEVRNQKPETGNRKIKIALVGNPNSGKSTLFNVLTGLKQNTANFPGITVDKKTGACILGHLESNNPLHAEIIDLPGTYSLYPKSSEEKIAVDIITDSARKDHPDIIICIADASNLKRSLLLCTQLIDLKTPVVLALNMIDLAKAKNLTINTSKLSEKLGVDVIPINARKKQGVEDLKRAVLTSDLRKKGNVGTPNLGVPAKSPPSEEQSRETLIGERSRTINK